MEEFRYIFLRFIKVLCVCVCVLSHFSRVGLFVTRGLHTLPGSSVRKILWAECGSGYALLQGIFWLGIELASLSLLHWQVGYLPLATWGSPQSGYFLINPSSDVNNISKKMHLIYLTY